MLASESVILKALNQPPRKISDLFAAKFSRVQHHDLADNALKILRYCGCTKRPITVNEFGELLSVSTSQTSLDRTGIPQHMDQIIAACNGLVYIEEEERTVHYVHHSVKQHLFNAFGTESAKFDENETDVHLGCLCLTYLHFSDFKRQVRKANPVFNIPVAPIDIGLVAVQGYGSTINDIARKLLKARRPPQQLTTVELSRRIEDILGEADASRLEAEIKSRPYYLLNYAQSHEISHSSRFEEDSQMWHLFSACVRGDDNLARRPWIQDNDLGDGSVVKSPTTTWALAHNHAGLLLYNVLHDSCKPSDGDKSDILRHAVKTNNRHLVLTVMNGHDMSLAQDGLYSAAQYGREHLLELFIAAGANVHALSTDQYQRTALQAAAEGGHLKVVERLLAAKVDVNAASGMHNRSALPSAAYRGHLEVVERLLAPKFGINNVNVTTALEVAAEEGHLEVVERILAAKATVDTRYALELACGRGHLNIIDYLLTVRPKLGVMRALEAAAQRGHFEAVERLLASKTNINATTALEVAAVEGHIEVVEQLLGATAKTNTTSALQNAARRGRLAVVERLLATGADVNAAASASYIGRTALQAAVDSGDSDVVKKLLDAKADVNATAFPSRGGRTALQLAAERGNLDILKRLLAAKADVDATTIDGLTALQLAANQGHLEVVEQLKLAGARK